MDRHRSLLRPLPPVRLWFDDRLGRLSLYDGATVFVEGAATATAATFGSGCGGPAAITTAAAPRLGDREFGFELGTLATSPVLFGVATAQQATPLPGGCQLLIGPALATSFALADGNGIATVRLPLPFSPALRGLAVFAQAGALDPATGALSISEGLRIVVGD